MDADDVYRESGIDMMVNPNLRAVHALGTFIDEQGVIDKSGLYESFGLSRKSSLFGVPYNLGERQPTTLT